MSNNLEATPSLKLWYGCLIPTRELFHYFLIKLAIDIIFLTRSWIWTHKCHLYERTTVYYIHMVFSSVWWFFHRAAVFVDFWHIKSVMWFMLILYISASLSILWYACGGITSKLINFNQETKVEYNKYPCNSKAWLMAFSFLN